MSRHSATTGGAAASDLGKPVSRAEREAIAADEFRAYQVDQDIFDELAAEFVGLNRTDMRVIDVLQREGPLTAGQLATTVRLTSGAVTAVVDRLENAGYVRRIRDTVDRRRVMIEATPKIDEVAAPVFGPVAVEGYRRMKDYSDEQLDMLLDFIRMSREFLQRHAARVQNLIEEQRTTRGEIARER